MIRLSMVAEFSNRFGLSGIGMDGRADDNVLDFADVRDADSCAVVNLLLRKPVSSTQLSNSFPKMACFNVRFSWHLDLNL